MLGLGPVEIGRLTKNSKPKISSPEKIRCRSFSLNVQSRRDQAPKFLFIISSNFPDKLHFSTLLWWWWWSPWWPSQKHFFRFDPRKHLTIQKNVTFGLLLPYSFFVVCAQITTLWILIIFKKMKIPKISSSSIEAEQPNIPETCSKQSLTFSSPVYNYYQAKKNRKKSKTRF